MAGWGRLRVLDGSHEGTVFVLEREVHTLGRGQASDFRLADPTVSRVQAEFRVASEGVLITGLSDKNPVWVNGEPAGQGRRLSPGDKVQVGLVHLVFEEAPPAAQAPPPPIRTPVLAVTTAGGILEPIPAAPAAAPDKPAPGTPCPKCGARELPGARFCGSCGARIFAIPPAASMATLVPGAAAPHPPGPIPTGLVRTAPFRGEDPPPTPHVRTDTMARPPEFLGGPEPSEVFGRDGGPTAAPGTVLKGRYELRRHLGHGRAAEVYEAWDRETRELVAVKVLLASLAADPESRDCFFHAANAFVFAAHPRLLKVHSVHESGGLCFSVTDLKSGSTLRDQLRARPASAGGFTPDEGRRLGIALCEALSKLHAVGAHGEVGPGNVWIDGHGDITLMDAVLAAPPGKAVRWPPSPDIAAALYTAPEVLKGAAPEPRSDLYAVGVTLYHALTGELPAGRVPPLRQARPDLPAELSLAVDRAMALRPEDRFPSAEEMRRVLSGESGSVRSAARRRLLLMAGGVAAVLLVAFSAIAWGPSVASAVAKMRSDPALEARVAEARAAEEGADREFAALGSAADKKVRDRAREAFGRGDAARLDRRFEEAEKEYVAARGLLDAESREVKERTAAREREKGAGAALDGLLAGAAEEGAPLEGAAADLRKRLEGEVGPPAGSPTLARVEHEERAAALGRVAAMAEAALDRWRSFATKSDVVMKAKEDRARALTLLEGAPASAETLDREVVLKLGNGLISAMASALQDGNVGPGPGSRWAQEAGDAALLASSGKVAEGSRAFTKAIADCAAEVPARLEAAIGVELRKEQALRCPACAGEGLCTACKGTGKQLADCTKCGGKGTLDETCAKCAGSGKVPCARCAGKALVDETCKACAGRGIVVCEKCGGKPPPCPACDGKGQRKCLRCRGTGTLHAAGEAGKPCPDCNHTGFLQCSVCGGRGTSVCPLCGGKAEHSCADCAGKGKKPVPCPDCAGTGKRPCAECGATGKVKVDCPDCEEGKVAAPCPACKGERNCPACGGSGRRK